MSQDNDDLIESILRRGLELSRRFRPLRAAYRVQFAPGQFGFVDAQAIVDYLEALGISHFYASPHLRCRRGSVHGYDIVDHGEINTQLGTGDDLAELHRRLAERDLSMMVDWVPNHMGTGQDNPYWMDTLENGASSPFAPFFDIDWKPVKSALTHRVLVPVLGDFYGLALERGEIRLEFDRGSFFLSYFEHRFPVAPRGYSRILSLRLDALSQKLGAGHADLHEYHSIVTSIENLPLRTETSPERLVGRRREKEVIKRRLAQLTERNEVVAAHVRETLDVFNGDPGDPQSYVLLDSLLEMQAYRLAFWKVALEEINYRRFFDINELVAIRMEDPAVFSQAHRLLMTWIERGWVSAVRIDHPDGLFDPREYFQHLQAEALLAFCRRAFTDDPPADRSFASLEPVLRQRCLAETAALSSGDSGVLLILVEKILTRGERLPASWAVAGSTGYDFLNSVNGLFVDPSSARSLDRTYRKFSGPNLRLDELVYRCKKLVVQHSLASELNLLAHRLETIAEADPRTRDFTLGSLSDALLEIIACFPVYRTYIPLGEAPIDERDRGYVNVAVDEAMLRLPTTSRLVFEFIRDILLKNHTARTAPSVRDARHLFVGNFQQLTSPATAKGVEDSAFYVYNRLVSQNEVGGDPDSTGLSVVDFHELNRDRLAHAAMSLLATSTHDTKRSEDVRLRIDALSEMPDLWHGVVTSWEKMNRRLKRAGRPGRIPDGYDEYMFYQTLVGAWPGGELDAAARRSFSERMQRYMLKAAREAKVHTSWTNNRTDYEEGLLAFTRGVIDRPYSHPFWRTFFDIHTLATWAGMQSSLSQVVLKATSPGIPDFYQGTELWDLHLVDPDNRGPVDFEKRRQALDELARRATGGSEGASNLESLVRELAGEPGDGRVKLYVTWRCLRFRRKQPQLFTKGDYLPLPVEGDAADHVVAFVRRRHDSMAIVVAGRLFLSLSKAAGVAPIDFPIRPEAWGETRLALPERMTQGFLRDVFTGRSLSVAAPSEHRTLRVADLFGVLPVALLECDLV
ncbi:MAG: malto-oligosyltrehalose synthase [Candidatus Riflebacteria bacterium]|nr:malto-oligosyltrehalose synthase [Candidatus Riflebacteria bacterium]